MDPQTLISCTDTVLSQTGSTSTILVFCLVVFCTSAVLGQLGSNAGWCYDGGSFCAANGLAVHKMFCNHLMIISALQQIV
jgi:hypothetical protein